MQRFAFDRFEFDPADGSLSQPGSTRAIRLRPAVATALLVLLREHGGLVERERMCEALWEPDRVVDFEAGLAAVIRELRKSIELLGGDSSLVETLPRRGYRLCTEIRELTDAAESGRHRQDAHERRGGQRRRQPGPLILGLAGLVAVVVLALLLWPGLSVMTRRGGPVAVPDPAVAPSLAILPIRVYGESPLLPEHVSILLADSVLAELWRAGPEELTLLGRVAIQPYLDRDDLAVAVAEDLGLSLLLDGNLRVTESGWWLEVQLLQIPPGRVLWSYRVETSAEPLIVNALAQRLAGEILARWAQIRSVMEAG